MDVIMPGGIKIKTTVTRKSNGKAKKNIKEQKEPDLEVGIFEGSKYLDGKQVAQIAYYQEFGTHDGLVIPPRPAWRLTVKEKRNEWVRNAVENLKSIAGDEKAIWKVYNNLGLSAQTDISEKIGSNLPPTLAPETIRRKKKKGIAANERTLVETQNLQQSVAFVNRIK